VKATTTFVSVFVVKPSKIGRTADSGASLPAETSEAIEIAVAWVSCAEASLLSLDRIGYVDGHQFRCATRRAAYKLQIVTCRHRSVLKSCRTVSRTINACRASRIRAGRIQGLLPAAELATADISIPHWSYLLP
jgi:hypothetical protein